MFLHEGSDFYSVWPVLKEFFPAGSDLGVLFQEQHRNEKDKEKEEYID